MYRVVASFSVFALFAAISCVAQSTDASAQSQSQAPASTASQSAPAGANTGTAPASDPAKKKPKKVWTNDEMPSVSGNVSVVGDSTAPRQKNTNATSSSGSNSTLVANYRRQILQLRAQMDKVDKEIADFRNFKPDNSSGGMNPHARYLMTSPEDRIKQLEDRKKQIQAKIDVIEDAARKEGIEPGQLR